MHSLLNRIKLKQNKNNNCVQHREHKTIISLAARVSYQKDITNSISLQEIVLQQPNGPIWGVSSTNINFSQKNKLLNPSKIKFHRKLEMWNEDFTTLNIFSIKRIRHYPASLNTILLYDVYDVERGSQTITKLYDCSYQWREKDWWWWSLLFIPENQRNIHPTEWPNMFMNSTIQVGRGGVPLIWPIQERAAGVWFLALSVLDSVYTFLPVCAKEGLNLS